MAKYYHVKKHEDYDSLMEFLEFQGYRWYCCGLPTQNNFWEVYKTKTVIKADVNKLLTYGEKCYFEEFEKLKSTDFLDWESTMLYSMANMANGATAMMLVASKRMAQITDSLQRLSDALNRMQKEKKFVISLPDLKTTDGETQYLSLKNGCWFASRKNTRLKQRFTESELHEIVPRFYQSLAIEVKEHDSED